MEKIVTKPLDISKLTEEEFCREIQKGLDDIDQGRTMPARDFFKEFREEYGI